MIDAIQSRAEALGEGGCYFLSLCYLAEKLTGHDLDPIDELERAVRARYARPNCYLDAADAILSMLTGKGWVLQHVGSDYQVKNGELEILRYEWPRPGNVLSHFVVGDGKGSVEYDPLHALGKSPVVVNGRLVSKRVFRREE